MLFSSIIFLFTFLPIALLLYYIAPRRIRNPVLLILSLVFYAWGEPVYVFLMVFSILFNYISGIDIARNLGHKRPAKKSLVFNIIVNLLILGFFKYSGFLIEGINRVLPADIAYTEPALPIGISFYTFQILSYIIDVYRGTVKVQTNLLNFGVYVTMFPQLIAGPIVKYKDIAFMLTARKETLAKFGEGAMYFIRGLCKKVLLANVIGQVYTKAVSLEPSGISVATAWIGCAAYTFQIYFDFSGYSDMAVGLGKMFGFDFMKNFNYPYISGSITEFWRRWHISLSTWFKEYVYIPLGGNRTGTGRHVFNLLAVWLLTGLWHGSSWNFVVWGLYYGVILLAEKYLLGRILNRLPGLLKHLYTMVLVMAGWVLFAGDTLKDAARYLGHMFGIGCTGLFDQQAVYFLTSGWMIWLVLLLSSTPFIYNAYRKMISYAGNKRVMVNSIVYGFLFMLCIAFLVTETYNPFLYFRF